MLEDREYATSRKAERKIFDYRGALIWTDMMQDVGDHDERVVAAQLIAVRGERARALQGCIHLRNTFERYIESIEPRGLKALL